MAADTLRVGITCYPSVGGSGVLATALGEDLAARGHDVHFIAYERPFRLPSDAPRLHFHPVAINEYELFRFPDYTLPLSVRMAEVSRDHRLDVLHVHYAVPHATAAILARAMLPPGQQPRVVTTLTRRCSATTPATRPPSSTRWPHRTRSPPCPSRSSVKPSACSTSTARSRSSTTSSRRARPAARPRSCAASSASAMKSSWCTRPTCATASASTSCWKPPRACARSRPSSSSSSPVRRSRRSLATCGASA